MTNRALQRALYWSAGAHAALLLLFIVNPSLPKSGPKGEIRYINLGLGGGGGGGGGMRGPAGGGSESVAETPLPKPQLRDLTTAQKAEAEAGSELRYPAAKKPPRKKPVPAKTNEVTRPDPNAKTSKTPADKTSGTAGGRTGGSGGGLTIGGGSPGFGEGSGMGGYGDQIGMGNFPYQYYLQTIQDRISARWFQSFVDPGTTGIFQVTVYFRIFRNGTISRVEVKESSGLRALDLSAQRAITDASPFPPLPDDYDEEYLGIIINFEHVK